MWELLAKGGILMIPIGLCSLMAVTIILERFWMLRRQRIISKHTVAEINRCVQQSDAKQAIHFCRASSTLYATIALQGLLKADHSRTEIKETMEEAGRKAAAIMEYRLNLLGTIAMISPLLGLLGTVLGMIKVFAVISSVGVGDPNVLANGISEALVSTAAGLSVAIPALAFHRHFHGRVDNLIIEMEQSSLQLVEQIKRHLS
ncbi:MotA/TolQ/ExbB proton channel family protein [Magnetococcales bacterium HHB-1]